MNSIYSDLLSASPLISITVVSLVVLLIEAFVRKSEQISFWASSIGLVATILLSIGALGDRGMAFSQMITIGGYANFFGILFLLSALFTVILSRDYLAKTHTDFGEFYLLILLATIGMMLMASAADLLIVFLGLELMSICLYVLVGFTRRRVKSNESSLKYFLLGAFATGFLVYGIALIYGSAGTTAIPEIVSRFTLLAASKMFWAGLALLLVGFAFKVAAVPFHMWVPDVYEGAPTTVTGFMSTGAKAAAFASFVLVFAHTFSPGENLQTTFAVIASASMILGNVVAISQSNIKRMLAYSSIAHAGYILIGLAAANSLGTSGILFYLLTYMFMNIGAFGVISLLEREEEKHLTIDDYAGLSSSKPFLAALMAIFMFSLSGLPPFGGFFGKYYIFASAVRADLTWLAILGVLTSVIGVYYYVRVVVVMYFQEGGLATVSAPSKLSMAVLALAALAILHLGVFPSSVLSLINSLFS